MASKRDMRLSQGKYPLSYLGSNPYSPANVTTDDKPPTTGDYLNFTVGDIWIDRSASPEDPWILVSVGADVGTWVLLSSIAGAGTTHVTDAGSAIPVASLLNVLGGTNVDTAGAGNTVTVNAPTASDVASTYDADVGSAVPVANVLNVLGGTNVDTSGAGDTLTINAPTSSDIATTYDADVGSAVPVANILNVLGGTNVDTAGAGDTVTVNASTPSDVATTYTTDSGNAIPAANVINILGGTNVNTSGSGSTVTIDATATGGSGSSICSFQARQRGDGGNPYTANGIYLGAEEEMSLGFDVGGDFDLGDHTTSTPAFFTAPQDGKYLLEANVLIRGNSGSGTTIFTAWLTIETTFKHYQGHGTDCDSTLVMGYVPCVFSVVASMAIGDTAKYFVESTGFTGRCSPLGGTLNVTSVSGTLLA